MRRKKESKGKLYLFVFIVAIVLIVWLGTKEIPNEPQDVVVDITEQVKTKS